MEFGITTVAWFGRVEGLARPALVGASLAALAGEIVPRFQTA